MDGDHAGRRHDGVTAVGTTRYRVVGMDCSDDAFEIESAARSIGNVEAVKVSVATQTMTLSAEDSVAKSTVEQLVSGLGYRLLEIGTGPSKNDVAASYKRALWIVVVLNVGYGAVEMIGGVLSGSQALKADALDFLGDGAITFLGLVAIGWSLVWRARSALIQGTFLGALGLGVLGNTVYRLLLQEQPDAELMGILGFVALAVNVAAALVLLPHRAGDSGVRAVWLFSRNDAIGNAAVVLAAGLVAWTGSPWPDLAVAIAIATLFLHSAWNIIRDARGDLSEMWASGG